MGNPSAGKRKLIGLGTAVAVCAVIAAAVTWGIMALVGGPEWENTAPPADPAAGIPAGTRLDLSAGNRRALVPGLYDWSRAGYRGGQELPGAAQINPDPACRIDATGYGVTANDGQDDTDAIQYVIDQVKEHCSPGAGYDKLSLIALPSGTIDVSHQIGVDADFLVIRGAADGGTKLVFRPDDNTAYDTLTSDGSDWDENAMTSGDGKGGWLWPGRALFKVQSRAVHEDYQKDYEKADDDRKDLFEGTVNVHWKSGVKLAEKPGDAGYAARLGDTTITLAGKPRDITVGGLVNVRAANSASFYRAMGAGADPGKWQNLHMRQQIFTVTKVDGKTITLDKPLEYDVPVSSTSDGSAEIDGKSYDSKVAPIVDPVVGVGIENLSITQDTGLDAAAAAHNYGNMDPAHAMNGIVLKWVADCWVRGVRTEMTGSHPLVTEEAYHVQIVGNSFTGAWNKGKGGNGYFRGSRVWDSLYAENTTRGLRHFTFQWSASGNVVIGNDFDSDLNLHGGWERNNLFELNKVAVPFEHRSGNCSANCGEEGGGGPDESAWYPIWWGAGAKAVKWSGATGPRNVFHGNELTKQETQGGPFAPFYPDKTAVYQFGWGGTTWQPLSTKDGPIADWAGHEKDDYSGGSSEGGSGVFTGVAEPGASIFLKEVAR
ncbi:hypothetical protein Afil01_42380 [Actinorhabdospora filicis]|uniref:Uncharacterized protein n=1 Tax=Actinorhabdospora filicis TaxID=1785913 RepID=A0A9W6WBC5_9ACTN|nr:hypothetical protein [Actinorhabdospora filicis]GLZ79431.1 hypothetical protein Afil01_42380 [Actinorhabdospora filicis]